MSSNGHERNRRSSATWAELKSAPVDEKGNKIIGVRPEAPSHEQLLLPNLGAIATEGIRPEITPILEDKEPDEAA